MRKAARIIAVMMAILSFFTYALSDTGLALAQELQEQRELDASIADMKESWEGSEPEELEYSPLVGEDEERREEYTKHFRREDGLTEAVTYPYPVHYEQDGAWKDIDNRLALVSLPDGSVAYQNAANDFQVQFAANLNSEKLVEVSYQGHGLSWKLAGAGSAPGTIDALGGGDTTIAPTDEERDMALRFPEELSGGITYIDPGSGAQIRYEVTGKSIAELITIDEAPTGELTYRLEITSGTVTPVKEGGTVYLKDANDETVFVINEPVMWDAKGNEGGNVEVTVEPIASEGQTANVEGAVNAFAYTITPDAQWLSGEECAYPVTIDPDIQPVFRGTVDNTYISRDDPNTNYNGRDRLKIGGTPRYRSLIKITGLPKLEAGDVVVESTMNLSRYNTSTAYGKEIDLYRVIKPWNASKVTWNSLSPDSAESVATNRVESLAVTQRQNYFNTFDITRLVKLWYGNPSQNHGMILKSWDESKQWYTEYRSSNYNASYPTHPFFSVIYINTTGLEGNWTYHSQDVGRAGAGSVNAYTGNLAFTRTDATISNREMPIEIEHVYNTNDKDRDIGYGNGWRINYAQSVEAVSLKNRTTTSTYYRHTDGDGTRHYYVKQTATKYVNELDKDSVLTINTTNKTITISDKGDNKLVFECEQFDHDGNASTGKEWRGRLKRIEDANGNKTFISHVGVTMTNLRVSKVQEQLKGSASGGQSITLSYTGTRLSGITPPDGLKVTLAYTGGRLTRISNTDGKHCEYTYNANGCLSKARNIDGYEINYTYTAGAPYRVTKAEEKNGSTQGQWLSYKYGWGTTAVKDKQGRQTVYQFDNMGQPVSVRDEEGNAVFGAYNTSARTVTQLSAVSKVQATTVNLMPNHGFEQNDSWSLSGSASYDSTKRHAGKQSMKLTSTSAVRAEAAMGKVLEQGETYTLSCYFSGSGGAGKIEVASGLTMLAESEPIELGGTAGVDWHRGSVTFSPISSGATIILTMPEGTAGTVYVDSVMLEKGETPNRYNMLENSDFILGTSNFQESANIGSGDGVIMDAGVTHPSALSGDCYRIIGNADKQKWIYQTIPAAGQKGDTYSFGGWLKASSIARSTQSYNNRTYGIKRITVEFLNASGGSVGDPSMVYFRADTDDWQYACGTAIAPAAYAKIRLSANYHYSRNNAYFDGLQLYREEFSQAYTYDANGNLTGYKSLIGQEDKLVYDSGNNVTKSTDARGNATTYTYDTKHNPLTSTSAEGVITSNTYNANGQATETRTGSASAYIRSSTQYEQQSGNITRVTDGRGKSVSYAFNSSTRQNTSVTDAEGNATSYTYGNAANMLRLSGISAPELSAVTYAYDANGKMTGITRGGTQYGFTYDVWGRTAKTKVGEIVLSSNTYDTYGRLSTVTYGNGYSMRYIYDEMDRVKLVKTRTAAGETEITAYEYVYNGEGDLYEVRNHRSNRATFFEYDHAGRCMSATAKTFTVTGGKIRYTGTEAAYRYEYDPNNNLSKLKQSVNGEKWTVTYTYDKDNRPKTTRLNNGKIITNNYDAMGRITSRTIGLGTAYTTRMGYLAGANGSQTALLSSYKNGNDAQYEYTYDGNGNITNIRQGDKVFSYEYDGSNQLVRENLYYSSGSKENKTITYEYDGYGNRVMRNLHPYSSGELLAAKAATKYDYSPGDWQDQLVSVNGSSITYDDMGNPTSYRGKNLTWEGKQLVEHKTVSYVGGSALTISFTYDENGIRQTKTSARSAGSAGSVTTRYHYNGKALMGQSDGTHTLLFSYDGNGNAASVRFNGTDYYYLYNGQGDVVKLIDGNGATQVEYTYDTWGACTTTGAMAGTLGLKNPFRYRGYVYDSDTGLYYLESRYYDPETGRFLSADNTDVLSDSPMSSTNKNLYSYCDNNPIVRADNSGELWNLIIGAAVGAVAGFVGQVVSDIVTSVISGEVTISNWQTYTGAVVGGAVGGAILGGTGNVALANAATGAITTGVGQSLEKLTIKDYDKSWAEIGFNTVADGAISIGLGKLPGVNKITKGRNSHSAVYKSGLTKLRNGTASRMSLKVIGKGLSSSIVGGYALDGYYGLKQHAYDRIKILMTH